jgi:hypothetical protein
LWMPRSRRFPNGAGGTCYKLRTALGLPLTSLDLSQSRHRRVHDRDDGQGSGRKPGRGGDTRGRRPVHQHRGRGLLGLDQDDDQLVGRGARPGGQDGYRAHWDLTSKEWGSWPGGVTAPTGPLTPDASGIRTALLVDLGSGILPFHITFHFTGRNWPHWAHDMRARGLRLGLIRWGLFWG